MSNTLAVGKIVATEKAPTTVDEFFFWTKSDVILKPFDVVKVSHIDSITYGIIESISHLTDGASSLAGFISSDFGDISFKPNMHRIGMNYVKARVTRNTKDIYTPVRDGEVVSLVSIEELKDALGLSDQKNPLVAGYLQMYEKPNQVTLPVYLNSHFLIGPEGAHLNISGISGLAAKTSYAMFLMKAIQDYYSKEDVQESVAFVVLNVKGRDLLSLDEQNSDLAGQPEKLEKVKDIYKVLGLDATPFKDVHYYYPHSENQEATFAEPSHINSQKGRKCASHYRYVYEQDRAKLDSLFTQVDDPNQTIESIIEYILGDHQPFNSSGMTWTDFQNALNGFTQASSGKLNSQSQATLSNIPVASWRKFYRIFRRIKSQSPVLTNSMGGDIRLEDALKAIKHNQVMVVDIARLDDDTQGFVFGDVMQSILELKLGQTDRSRRDIPTRIIIFMDELNKYASKEIPKSSPILRRILEIAERGRSLGVVLFGAEQFKSDIHDRVKGNSATHAYGRTNAIEVAKSDYQYIPPVYKSMMTRLDQGEYILQNPMFRSLLSIKFPHPLYKQYPNG